MSRLTRDGTAEPVSRDHILRHARGQGNVHFPCSADHEQDYWQPYPVDPYSAICDDHTYIHTYSFPFVVRVFRECLWRVKLSYMSNRYFVEKRSAGREFCPRGGRVGEVMTTAKILFLGENLDLERRVIVGM